MYRKLRDQAKRHNLSVGTVRGLLKLGLRHSQTETGTIFISDEAMTEFFTAREKVNVQSRRKAESIANQVL